MEPQVIEWMISMPEQLVEVRATQARKGAAMFEWSGAHDLWQFWDRIAFEMCDFTRATELSFRSGYVFKGGVDTYYFGCSIYGHCSAGQKLELDIVDGTGNTGSYHGHTLA